MWDRPIASLHFIVPIAPRCTSQTKRKQPLERLPLSLHTLLLFNIYLSSSAENTEKFYWTSFEFILEAVNMNYLLSDRTNLCFKVVSGCLALFFCFCFEYVKPGSSVQSLLVYSGEYNPSKDPDSIITLPQVIRWWLFLQKTLLFCQTFSTAILLPYIFLNICDILFQPQTDSVTDRKTKISGPWFYSRVRQWQLRGVCVCVCQSVCLCVSLSVGWDQAGPCWFWCIELLPVCHIQLQRGTADAHSSPVCARVGVCVSLTSSCVMLTWRTTSIRLWFGWLGSTFHHTWG